MSIPSRFDEHASPRLSRAVHALIAVNLAVVFLQWTVVSHADAFALLGFREGGLQRTLWSALTYMFVHFGVWHLALNMYALFTFGPRLEGIMGSRTFALYFIWCGIGGAVAHLLFVRTGVLVGSSAAVLGVMYGYAQQWPNEELALFGVVPIRAWTMFVLFAVATFMLGLLGADDAAGGGARIAYLAHLGGLAFGWLYLRTPPAESIERLRQRISPAPDYQDETPRAIPRTLPRARAQRDEVDEIVAKSKAIASQQQPRPATRALVGPVRAAEPRAGELDLVLDKISSHGLESLTPEELALLDAAAKRLRSERKAP
jgi:membrane associated rhomboid family serine protease